MSEPSLHRLLKPKTIAIVGMSDSSGFAHLVEPTLASDAEVFFVNPRHRTVLGRPTVPSLSSLDRPVDAVASFMKADRTTALVEEAASLDVGGMVLVAASFAETGPRGALLQQRIRRAATSVNMPVIGPNGLGYINVRHGIGLTLAARHKRRPGGISVVSQSGAMLSGVGMAVWGHSGCGLNLLISSGNEAVTDLADYVEYLVDDPETTSIGLVLEEIRRPSAFFTAVERAVDEGKPIVALKLGRRARSKEMARSHTAAVAGDAWAYEVALRQAGVACAYDPEELADRLAMIDQIPRKRWTAVNKLGVLSTTGGFATLSFDLAETEGLDVPRLDSFRPWVRETLPGVTVPNPLDATGLSGPIWPTILDKYVLSDELDSLLVVHPVADEDEPRAKPTVAAFGERASSVAKPCVLANCAGSPGEWVKPLLGEAVALGRGVRATLRGLHTLGSFERFRARQRSAAPPIVAVAPPSVPPVVLPEGSLVPFDATMKLLAAAGIPVSPYHVIPSDRSAVDVRPGFPGPYAVKLADLAHRTELDAVRLNVRSDRLVSAVTDLRDIAAREEMPSEVVVQPMAEAIGELFVGIQGAADLGALVMFGLGGLYVEALGRVAGRIAPFSTDEATRLIDEFSDLGVMHGARGKQAWDLADLARILVSFANLAEGGRQWIKSLDVNPMIYGHSGFLVVDAALLLHEDGDTVQRPVTRDDR